MVAVAVAGIGLTVLASGFSLNLRATGAAADVTTATHLARTIVFDARVGEPVAGRREGDFGSDYPRFRWQIDTSEISAGEPSGDGPRLWRHEVTVSVDRLGQTRTVRLDSLRLVEPATAPGAETGQ